MNVAKGRTRTCCTTLLSYKRLGCNCAVSVTIYMSGESVQRGSDAGEAAKLDEAVTTMRE